MRVVWGASIEVLNYTNATNTNHSITAFTAHVCASLRSSTGFAEQVRTMVNGNSVIGPVLTITDLTIDGTNDQETLIGSHDHSVCFDQTCPTDRRLGAGSGNAPRRFPRSRDAEYYVAGRLLRQQLTCSSSGGVTYAGFSESLASSQTTYRRLHRLPRQRAPEVEPAHAPHSP